MKKDPKKLAQQVNVQYVPYEEYLSKILVAMNNRLEKMERHLDVIKERLTFEAK